MKILCVDDDPFILELLTEVLRAIGLTSLHCCTSADEALAKIDRAEVPFDCFLFDIQMPGKDGIELVSIVRRFPQYSKTPILMITAMSDRNYIDRAFAAGASDYITKPFELGEVHARLRLIESLVTERKQMHDRNPVSAASRSLSIVPQADMDECLAFIDIDGFIEFLALENYLLKISRLSLFGMYAVGIVVPNLERTFRSSSAYEYKCAVSDYAEAISSSLKPSKFMAAHAGGGEFVCVLENGNQFKAEEFETVLNETLEAMELFFCDGRPLSLQPVVGNAVSLQMRSSKNILGALIAALTSAKNLSRTPLARQTETHSPINFLFGR